jgi:DNA repair ATPase RecN
MTIHKRKTRLPKLTPRARYARILSMLRSARSNVEDAIDQLPRDPAMLTEIEEALYNVEDVEADIKDALEHLRAWADTVEKEERSVRVTDDDEPGNSTGDKTGARRGKGGR